MPIEQGRTPTDPRDYYDEIQRALERAQIMPLHQITQPTTGGVGPGLEATQPRDVHPDSSIRSGRWVTSTTGLSMDMYGVNTLRKVKAAKPSASVLTRRRAEEKEWVERFIDTGHSQYVYTLGDGIVVRGHTINSLQTLFTIQGRIIKANRARTKHLKPLLERLAKRENLVLSLTRDRVAILPQHLGPQVIYYAWDNADEVDDTALFKAKVRVEEPGCPPDGCNDGDCESCYPEEEDYDEEF